MIFIVLYLLAYLLGSIPTAVWIGKIFYKIDIREHGSGNAGTTNTFRILGKTPGIFVFVIDVLKGFAAVSLAFIPEICHCSEFFMILKITLGIISVIGHIFPVFAKFRGGKGVATMLGIVLGIYLPAALVGFGVFLIVLLITKYVSVSSMTAGFFLPISVIVIFKETSSSLIIFSVITAILLVITHKKNIRKLIAKTENKISFNKKNNNIKIY